MSKGWIKLHRSIQDCFLWDKKPFDLCRAWIDLLLLANHSDKRILFDGSVVTVKAGCFITSELKLSERWGWSRGKTDRFLKMLESEEMIELDVSKKRTSITIVNYCKFQDAQTTDSTTDDTTDGQQTDNRQTTDRQQTDINKNDKNEKKEKNEKNEKNIRTIFYPNDEELNTVFGEYVLMRKRLKKPFTSDHAIQLAMNTLDRLSGGDSEKAIKIVNQSIEHSWQGLFELKGSTESNNTGIDWSKI